MLDPLSQKIYGFALKKLGANDIPEKKLQDKLEEKFIKNQKKYTQYNEYDPHKNQEILDKISEIITLLKSQKYLDDIRFCENFIRWRKEAMPRGKYMIIQELILKKIDEVTATQQCEKHISDQDEYEMCNILFQQKKDKLLLKYNTKEYTTPQNKKLTEYEIQQIMKQKIFAFLRGKQFPYSLMTEIWEKQK